MTAKGQRWWVYLIKCNDETVYTGITNDVPRRLIQHEQGVGAMYTRGRGPFTLLATEEFATRSEASKREYEIKQLSRVQKYKLIASQT